MLLNSASQEDADAAGGIGSGSGIKRKLDVGAGAEVSQHRKSGILSIPSACKLTRSLSPVSFLEICEEVEICLYKECNSYCSRGR